MRQNTCTPRPTYHLPHKQCFTIVLKCEFPNLNSYILLTYYIYHHDVLQLMEMLNLYKQLVIFITDIFRLKQYTG